MLLSSRQSYAVTTSSNLPAGFVQSRARYRTLPKRECFLQVPRSHSRQADANDMTSTSTEPVINRVSTLEQIAAEEGTGRGDPLPPLPPPPMQWQSAPSAESITEMISSFVQAEAATLRRDYFAHAKSRLVAARDKFDGVVDAIDDSVAHIIALY